MREFQPLQVEFGLERVRGNYVTIPSLFFGGTIPVTPDNTTRHEFPDNSDFDHSVIIDRNGFDVTFWTNLALRDRIVSLGVPVVLSEEITDDAYTRRLMRLDHEEEMGYDSHCGH